MKSLLLNGRMALLRKTSCLLTVLFALVATVFLLAYPLFVQNTRDRLEHAYDSVEVSGWLYNSMGYEDPLIEGDLWHSILDTGQIKTHYTKATVELKMYDASRLYRKVGENATAEEYIAAFSEMSSGNAADKRLQNIQAINRIEACEELDRQAGQIRWMDGYSADCLTGSDMICLLPAEVGYRPGALIPLRLKTEEKQMAVFCLRVAGVYPRGLTGRISAIVPIQTLETMFQQKDWPFYVNSFSFLVKDNREIPALKDTFTALGLDGASGKMTVRAAIDDRILDGTVSPIKSNLAMLQGLYRFFFAVVAAIGFFLCFLLTKSRRQEYAVMRLLGESALRVTGKAVLEQLLLCLTGVALGAAVLVAAGQGRVDLAVCGVILLCYTLGAAAAVVLTVRVDVMEILRDKE